MSSAWEKDADRLHASGARHAIVLSQSHGAVGQIALGLAQALAPRQVRVSAASAASGPVDRLAVKVLAELSVLVSEPQAMTLDEPGVAGAQAVLVVSEQDPTPPALQQALRIHWPFPDPAAGGGTDEEKLARYRAVRNELRRRFIRVFAREAMPPPAEAGVSTSIGPASGGDMEGIKLLLAAALLPSRDVVGPPGQRFILAAEGGRVLGCAGLQLAGQDALVRSMAVRWTRRNAGLGTRLHERLLHQAVLAGVRTLYVVTMTAEEFFARQGYRRAAADEVPAGLRASEEFAAFAPGGGTVMTRPVAPG
ncbi:MAG: GNAT family N-acetyltransferase [Deltaproteobacteria bacterium]|nr:GNAT family N-acetyltransferase [Deltaproteobacteria bacterium]